MKRFYLLGLLILAFSSCKRNSPAEPEPDFKPRETEDWIILTAPEEREVWGVYGNIDSTLIITTGYKIYNTQDRGYTWQETNHKPKSGIFGFIAQGDTLFALSTQRSGNIDGSVYATNPEFRSEDGGKTWEVKGARKNYDHLRIQRNRITASNGISYEIDQVLTPACPTCSNGYVDTPGYKTSSGRRVALPQEHYIQSIYLDSQQRVYLSSTAALCGKHQDFRFCDGRRGVIYISKKALP